MALQNLGAIIPWPNISLSFGTVVGLAGWATLDAAGEYGAVCIAAREDMTISHVGFRPGMVSGSGTVDIRIETVDSGTGLPTGTLWAANTNIAGGALTTSTWSLQALTAAASISRGQTFAVKIAFNSGTSVVVSGWSGYSPVSNLPYQVINAGSPTKDRIANPPFLALGSSSSAFYSVGHFVATTTVSNTTFNNTSSAKRGLRFQVPFKCRCVGLRTYLGTSTGDLNIIMMDDSGTELSSTSTARAHAQTGASTGATYSIPFDNPVTLTPGVWYRAVLEPTSATNIGLSYFTMPSADYISGTPFGANAQYTEYAGSWTDYNDRVPMIDLLVDQLDDGVSADSIGVIGG